MKAILNLFEQKLLSVEHAAETRRQRSRAHRSLHRRFVKFYRLFRLLKIALFWLLEEPKLYRRVCIDKPHEEVRRLNLSDLHQLPKRRE